MAENDVGRSSINVKRLTMWKQLTDSETATTYDTTARAFTNELNSMKYSPKMETAEQYGDGIKVEDYVAKDGGDIEAVIREQSDLTGEYLIRIFEKDFTSKYAVEVEKATGVAKDDETVAAEVSAALKARIGVKPAKVIVHPDGGLDTRSEHKSRRVIDERNIDYNI